MKVGTGESIVLEVKKVVVTPKFEVQQVDIVLPTHKKHRACVAKETIFISA